MVDNAQSCKHKGQKISYEELEWQVRFIASQQQMSTRLQQQVDWGWECWHCEMNFDDVNELFLELI